MLNNMYITLCHPLQIIKLKVFCNFIDKLLILINRSNSVRLSNKKYRFIEENLKNTYYI